MEKPVDAISIGPHIFIKHWTADAPPFVNITNCQSDFYGLYDFGAGTPQKNLSFSYFISNLITSISEATRRDRLWLLFPARGGKENYRYETAVIDMIDRPDR